MAADETNEKSLDVKTDASATQYKPESEDLKAAYGSRVEELGTAQAKRVADYLEDKARETSSWSILKDLRVSIIDSGVSILRKGLSMLSGNAEKTEDASGDKQPPKPTEEGGDGKGGNGAPDAGKDAENPTELGGDWIDNMVDLAVQHGAEPEVIPLEVLDDTRKVVPESDLAPNNIPLGVLDMLPKGANPEALPLGVPDDARTLTPGGEHAPAAPTDKSDEGAIGDRSKDSGAGTLEKQPRYETTTIGGKEMPTEYTMPDGQTYQIEYGADGKPSAVTIPDQFGKPTRFENKGGMWKDEDGHWDQHKLRDVQVDDKGRVVFVREDQNSAVEATRISGDGTLEKLRSYDQGAKTGIVDASIDASGKVTRGDAVTESGSHVTEIKSGDSVQGYEIKDDEGHVKQIKVEEGGVTVKTGDRTEHYDKVESDGKGGIRLIAKDKSTVEIGQDGVEVHKNPQKQVTSITNAEGETTTFERSGNNVTGVTVTDGQGKVVEHKSGKVEVTGDGSYTIELPKAELEDRKADGAEGTPTKLERRRDGTEQLLDKDGKHVESDADKLAGKIDMSPEYMRQFKQDLADIDRLPPEQRRKVYESLSKIADSGTYNYVEKERKPPDQARFTRSEQSELVTSLAHQIAHPESIQQGAHESCAAANMEELMARKHPDRYADIVSKLATEGKYEFPSGKVVHADTTDGYLNPKADAYGRRSFSSELFQDAAIQLAVDPKTYKSVALDSPDIEPRPKGVTPATDYGERLIDPNNPGAPEQFHGIDSAKQLQAYKDLFPGEKYGEVPVQSSEDLQKALDANGGPPMKVGISLKGDLADTGMGGEAAGSLEGNHAIVITEIKDGKVYYENTAGGKDHSYPHGEGVPIEKFTEAMKVGEKGAFVKGAEGKGGDATMEARKGVEGDMGAGRDSSSDAAALKRLKDDPEVKEHHEKLVEAAKDMKEPQKSEFLKNLDRFEARAAKTEESYKKQFEAQGMKPEDAEKAAEKKSQEQVEKSYENIERLLADNPGAPVNQADRILLAQEAMEHCADTTTVSQGNHETCYAASTETRVYAKDPAEATRMVADVATTGKYTTHGKNPVTIDYSKDQYSLQKQGEATEVPRKDGHRDFASQIFQVTAVNVALEQQNQLTQPPGKLRYEQHPDHSGDKPPDSNGERIVDYSHDKPRIMRYDIGINPPQTAEMLREISPSSSEGVTILSSSSNWRAFESLYKATEAMLEYEFKEAGMAKDLNLDINDPDRFKTMHDAIDKNEGLTDEKRKELHDNVNEMAKCTFEMKPHGDAYPGDDPERMKMFLAEAKRKGELPIQVSVECDREPFWHDSGAGKAGGSGGGHVVTITDFDGGRVKMQNQWDKGDNHVMSVEDLCKATTTSPELKYETMQAQVEKNRQENKIDYALESATLDMKLKAEKCTEAEYNADKIKVLQAWSDKNRREKHEDHELDYDLASLKHDTGKMSDQEYLDALKEQSAKIRKEGPANYSVEYDIIEIEHKMGKISNDEYHDQIVAVTIERQKERNKFDDIDPPQRVHERYVAASKKAAGIVEKIDKEDHKEAEKIKQKIRDGIK